MAQLDRVAYIFPGQGSQKVGMGRDLYQAYPVAREVFDEADRILGFSLSRLCFEGPEEMLTDTVNAQPAIFATSMACWRALGSVAPEGFFVPSFVAGHSMGEYSALAAAGVLDFVEGLQLVRERGRLMKLAGKRSPGGMAAILGLDDVAVDGICQQARDERGAIVQAANYNAPGQIVISGDKGALERAMSLAREAGARKVVRLAVSIAAHSPLMACIADEFRQAVEATPLHNPAVPAVANITASPLASVTAVRNEMVGQLTSPVRWVASMQYLLNEGVTTFFELGPSAVLTGLLKRIDRSARRVNVRNATDLQKLVGGLAEG
jgi:[acyl-carrier-protein] S-malonyltransferase